MKMAVTNDMKLFYSIIILVLLTFAYTQGDIIGYSQGLDDGIKSYEKVDSINQQQMLELTGE